VRIILRTKKMNIREAFYDHLLSPIQKSWLRNSLFQTLTRNLRTGHMAKDPWSTSAVLKKLIKVFPQCITGTVPSAFEEKELEVFKMH
jgi:hypothetical protein